MKKEARQYEMKLGGTKLKDKSKQRMFPGDGDNVINLVVSMNVAWMNYEMSGNVCPLSYQ